MKATQRRSEDRVLSALSAEATGEGGSYTGAFLKPVLARRVAGKRKTGNGGAGAVEAAE